MAKTRTKQISHSHVLDGTTGASSLWLSQCSRRSQELGLNGQNCCAESRDVGIVSNHTYHFSTAEIGSAAIAVPASLYLQLRLSTAT